VNKCKDCKHWGLSEYDDEVGVCLAIKHSNESSNRIDYESVLDDFAGVEDGSGYHACLVTGPEFGCIKWEAKQ
jgi:hypothetical protein